MQEYVRQLVEKKDEIFTREICDLQRHIRTTDHIQWFDVQRRFEPMGVKMIGVFCTMIKDLEFLDKTKYLAGFQQVPDLVPGFGEIEFNATKISMRVSQQLTDGIQSGKIAGLSSFLPEATTKIGGFVDACHGLSAATTVRIGQEQQLIDEIEKPYKRGSIHMSEGRGFGKTILIGDQFVLWEIPAILSAIPFETVCTVERLGSGSGWTLDDRRIEVPGYKKAKEEDCFASFNRMVEVMGLDLEKDPIKITVEGDLLAGSGVGASAAICVSFARACNEEFDLHMDIIDINHVAWEGEFGYHGLPSGLDNTVSTYGGVIKYRIRDGIKQFERVELAQPIEIVLGNSGVTANTASLKGFLEEQEAADGALLPADSTASGIKWNHSVPH